MRSQSGYTAFIAVLIVGAAAVSIGLTLLLAGTDSQRSTLTEQRSKQARALAIACAQEALQQIHDNIAYASNGNLSLGQGSCTYAVTVSTPTTRTISVDGTVSGVVRNLQASVTIGSTTISVTSWQEIP
jgi:hypothetical protein